ncbi:hypothetical protein PF001_g20217 [Phytophthora fragariae]|uniref:Uncharacterized protein n=1 Tax=Phytophthora fragariae TaxID=53985 RepID=A0A6A3IHL9_9STRA|nr:hypothetical protein PF011_g22003 [Phytophthora fragariae]KAE9289085.1 hypothetical protein PF001_g20217 [Phytophthora fragariae]
MSSRMTTTSASTAAMTAVGTRPTTNVNGSTLTTAITSVNMTTTVTTMTTATTGTGSGSVGLLLDWQRRRRRQCRVFKVDSRFLACLPAE